MVLCTADSGVFHTCLSREYALAAAAFQLREAALWQLAAAGVRHAFAPQDVKQALMAQIQARRREAEARGWAGDAAKAGRP